MLEHEFFFFFLSGPIAGIFGGAGSPVLRAMMSKIVSSDDQGKLTLSGNRRQMDQSFPCLSLHQLHPCSGLVQFHNFTRTGRFLARAD